MQVQLNDNQRISTVTALSRGLNKTIFHIFSSKQVAGRLTILTAISQFIVLFVSSLVVFKWHITRIVLFRHFGGTVSVLVAQLLVGLFTYSLLIGLCLWPLHLVFRLFSEKKVNPEQACPSLYGCVVAVQHMFLVNAFLDTFLNEKQALTQALETVPRLPHEIQSIILSKWQRNHRFVNALVGMHHPSTWQSLLAEYQAVVDWNRWMLVASFLSGYQRNSSIPSYWIVGSKRYWIFVLSRDPTIWAFLLLLRITIIAFFS